MEELSAGLRDHLQLDECLAQAIMQGMDKSLDKKISLEELWKAVQSESEKLVQQMHHVNGLYQRTAQTFNGMPVFEQVPSVYEGENALHIAIANKAEIFANVLFIYRL